MKRKTLKIEKKIKEDIKNGSIFNITQNINKIEKNSIFVAIKGINFDSHIFIKKAFDKGAKYVFGTQEFNHKNYYKINNSRKILSYLLNIFYDYPDKKLKIIGVVGTNGKTSTTYIFKNFMELFRLNYGVIGTNGIYINENYFQSNLTTPDSEELFFYLDKMIKNKVKYVIIEVSAHAIKLDKIFSINFSRLIFTNFSQDHLDFFKTMKEYKNTKFDVFKKYNYEKAIINSDDEAGKELINIIKKEKISYGYNGNIKLLSYNLNSNFTSLKIFVDKEYDIILPLVCDYNIYNFLSIFSLLFSYGFDVDLLINKTTFLKKLSGRFQVINFSKTHTIIIDYAHTPQSTKKTMEMVKLYFPNEYIISLFGCPGNREQQKREIIGKIVSNYSNHIFLTSDNPNFENPIKIMVQTKKKIYKKCTMIENREFALKKALQKFLLKDSCVLVLLGKGIENYQVINGVNIPYKEEEFIIKFINNYSKIS